MTNILFDTVVTVMCSIKLYFMPLLAFMNNDDKKMIEKKVDAYFESNKEIVKTRSSLNMLNWVLYDKFENTFIDKNSVNYKKLEKMKTDFLDFYFLTISKNKKDLKFNVDVHAKIEDYMLKIMKLRMILKPDIQIAKNVHTQSKITYIIAKAFWYDENGIKVRKFTKSLGRAEEYKNGVEDINAIVDAFNKIQELMIQTYREEYGV